MSEQIVLFCLRNNINILKVDKIGYRTIVIVEIMDDSEIVVIEEKMRMFKFMILMACNYPPESFVSIKYKLKRRKTD